MKYTFFVLLLLFMSTSLHAQLQIGGSAQALASTAESLPFWLGHNQNGLYNIHSRSNQLLLLNGQYQNPGLAGSPLQLEAGVLAIARHSDQFDYHFNQAYLRFKLWNWQLEGGRFAEKEFFGGISSTNGHIDRSHNARPYPRIRFGTQEFIPFWFWKNWFRFKAEYDEGLLNDVRTVENTRLHHKSLYLKAQLAPRWSFMLGLDHFVMWGGNSPDYGPLPDSFRDYITYVTGGMGTSNFPMTDQLNVAGNQYGSYRIETQFPLAGKQATFYINHPFEDHSGMELFNWEDNLYGLFVEISDDGWLQQLIWEYLFSTDQSGHLHIIGVMTGRDNYYNHGVYRTGHTYEGMAMSSPLFAPVISEPGKQSILNTRIKMHHLGARGKIKPWLGWMAYLTYSKNFGTFNVPYDPHRNQFAGLVRLKANSPRLPFEISAALATDYGQLYETRWGAMLSISKRWGGE